MEHDRRIIIYCIVISLLVSILCGMWFWIGRSYAPRQNLDTLTVWINDYLQVCVMDGNGTTHIWDWGDLAYAPDLCDALEDNGVPVG